MLTDGTERVRQQMLGRYADWVQRFNVSDYVQNPPLIEKLYEEKQLALTSSIDLEKKVRELESQVHEMKLAEQRLGIELDEANRRSNLLFALTLLATVLIGIGVNIATSSPNGWTGWVMIVAACILEIIAFISRPQKK